MYNRRNSLWCGSPPPPQSPHTSSLVVGILSHFQSLALALAGRRVGGDVAGGAVPSFSMWRLHKRALLSSRSVFFFPSTMPAWSVTPHQQPPRAQLWEAANNGGAAFRRPSNKQLIQFGQQKGV